jgi:membrane protein YqaA with SNARE-associated domain
MLTVSRKWSVLQVALVLSALDALSVVEASEVRVALLLVMMALQAVVAYVAATVVTCVGVAVTYALGAAVSLPDPRVTDVLATEEM